MAPTAIWTLAEETALADFLVEHKSEAGDGGNFKKPTFQRAANEIAPLLERGATKTLKSIQNKWAMFQKLYRIVRAIQAVSGWVWNDDTGASITPHTVSSWDDYVKCHPEAKPFRNKGWCHFSKVTLIMPSSAVGANIFHPTATQAEDLSSPTPSEPNSTPPPSSEPQDSPDSDDDSDTPPALVPTSRKRAREPATPVHPAAKRPRASHGAAALQDMSASLTQVGNALSAALAPPQNAVDPSPRRRTNAVAAALRFEMAWLDHTQLVSFIDLIRGDQTAADIYLALTEPDVHKEWVCVQLEKLGVIVF